MTQSTEDNLKLKSEFYKEFIAVQKRISSLGKEQKGYNYSYADLTQTIDAIKEAIADSQIGYMQSIEKQDSSSTLVTTIFSSNGYEVKSYYPIIPLKMKSANEVQSFGASVTYSKRYALQAAFGIATEDSDAAEIKSAKKNTHVTLSQIDAAETKEELKFLWRQCSQEQDKERELITQKAKSIVVLAECDANEVDLY